MSEREDMHREEMREAGMKVLIWNAIEACLLIGLAIWQISTIQKLFEVKRKV